MYVESKPGITGDARIGRVRRSKTGRTLYYDGMTLKSLKGDEFKANYFDTKTGDEFWISNCRRDRQDTLYLGVVRIDEDAREEYWITVRNRPDLVDLTEYRSEGKYSRRRPQPEKSNRPATGPRK